MPLQRNLINLRESFLLYRFVLVLSSSDHRPFATKIHLLSLCDHILILSLLQSFCHPVLGFHCVAKADSSGSDQSLVFDLMGQCMNMFLV